MLHAVVMAGGSGTRFWPKSRRARPKQLLRLYGDSTMLQQTVERIAPMVAPERTWIITAADQAEAVRAQLPDVPHANVGGRTLPARHGGLRRPGGVDRGQGRPRRHDDRHAGRPRHQPAETVPDHRPGRARGDRRRPGRLRHLRDPPDPGRDRLRLHRAGRAARLARGDRAQPGRPVPREARPGHRRALPGRRALRLELRDLRLAGPRDPRRPGHPPPAARRRRSTGSARPSGRPARPRSIAARVPEHGEGPDRQGRDGEGRQRPGPGGRLRLERRRRLAGADRAGRGRRRRQHRPGAGPLGRHLGLDHRRPTTAA